MYIYIMWGVTSVFVHYGNADSLGDMEAASWKKDKKSIHKSQPWICISFTLKFSQCYQSMNDMHYAVGNVL